MFYQMRPMQWPRLVLALLNFRFQLLPGQVLSHQFPTTLLVFSAAVLFLNEGTVRDVAVVDEERRFGLRVGDDLVDLSKDVFLSEALDVFVAYGLFGGLEDGWGGVVPLFVAGIDLVLLILLLLLDEDEVALDFSLELASHVSLLHLLQTASSHVMLPLLVHRLQLLLQRPLLVVRLSLLFESAALLYLPVGRDNLGEAAVVGGVARSEARLFEVPELRQHEMLASAG